MLLRDIQNQFTAAIRDPNNSPPNDVLPERMQVYQTLIFNNIDGFISSVFPLLKSLFSEAEWQNIVRDFLIQHRAKTPYFSEIGQEFLNFLQLERQPHAEDPPFLLELAHYEWVELALAINEAVLPAEDEIDLVGDLFSGIPVLSPLAWILSYHYPVHRAEEGVKSLHPSDSVTCLILYRTSDFEVKLLEINEITFHCLNLLRANPDWRGERIFQHLCELMQHPHPQIIMEGGRQIFEQLRQAEILLGVKKELLIVN